MIASLDEIKTYLGITASDQDDFLTEQGQIVSDAIEAYCRRKFESTAYTQTFYRSENLTSKKMSLFMFPVISIASIEEDEVALTGYRIHKPSGIVVRETGLFFCAEETVVTYTAGYATVPLLLKNVVYQVVGERYTKRISGVGLNFGSDVQRISIPGTISIDFDYSLSNNDRTTAFGGIIGNYLNQLDYFRSERALSGTDKLSYNDEVVP